MNARILRDLGLIGFGNHKTAEITEAGKFVLAAVSKQLNSKTPHSSMDRRTCQRHVIRSRAVGCNPVRAGSNPAKGTGVIR